MGQLNCHASDQRTVYGLLKMRLNKQEGVVVNNECHMKESVIIYT